MYHLRTALQGLMFALVLVVGGIGTAAAGTIGSASGHGISAVDDHGPHDVFKGCDKDGGGD